MTATLLLLGSAAVPTVTGLLAAAPTVSTTTTAAPTGQSGCPSAEEQVHVTLDPATGDAVYSSDRGSAQAGHPSARGADVAFLASATWRPGTSPVQRVTRPGTDLHAYATTSAQRSSLAAAGFTQVEGVAFYAATATDGCLSPVQRWVGPQGQHRLVISQEEGATLAAEGWKDGGTAFYAARDTRFSIAVLPDTQEEVIGGATGRFEQRMRWLVADRDQLDLRYVAHVGDVVNWDTPDHRQYVVADGATKVLDEAKIPFSYAIGNHDTKATCAGGGACPGDVKANQRDTRTFNTFFPPSRFTALAGVCEPGKVDNSYSTFQAGGEDWMVLNLELWPRTSVVDWARGVVAAHPRHNVILVTHSYLNSDGSIKKDNGGYGANSPQYVFDRLVKQYPNIRLVFSGHIGSTAQRVDTGVHGNKVYSILTGYHDRVSNPTRVIEIDTAEGWFSTGVVMPLTGEVKADRSAFTVRGVDWVR
ncbi:metallophosphoesterase [Pseudokineococcus sp. 1T1Z-3]|uniref:metallophosphoesterase n=1 Tax=Pseudokineococcus sp. 1T1Z-3 TaxID=3132745 RepID=UPI003094BC51